ncbi:hypothetical protein HC024_13970 [Methylococcaceae bacterium WWC4]|nr:hypothetical protein [Methylococcaceae bacterium WWC4]
MKKSNIIIIIYAGFSFVFANDAASEDKLYGGKRTGYTMATTMCLSINKLKGGFNVADHLVNNNCARAINVVGICLPDDYKPKRDYPYKGLYGFSSGWEYSLEPNQSDPDPLFDVCEHQKKSPSLIACYEGYHPYFTSSNGLTHTCIEE